MNWKFAAYAVSIFDFFFYNFILNATNEEIDKRICLIKLVFISFSLQISMHGHLLKIAKRWEHLIRAKFRREKRKRNCRYRKKKFSQNSFETVGQQRVQRNRNDTRVSSSNLACCFNKDKRHIMVYKSVANGYENWTKTEKKYMKITTWQQIRSQRCSKCTEESICVCLAKKKRTHWFNQRINILQIYSTDQTTTKQQTQRYICSLSLNIK